MLRRGAKPGSSKMVNDVLLAIGESRRGQTTLTRWCQCWADGRVPPRVATVLVDQVMRPLRKDNGKARNISLMEVLVKFASGVTQAAIRESDPAEGLGWSQYSAHRAGPELMLLVAQGIMRLRPGLAFASVDGENAYGTIQRSAMLKGAVEYCPKHSGFLACQWRAETKAWLEHAPGKWESASVVDGTAQGDTGSTPAFGRAYRKAITRTVQRLSTMGIWVHLPSLVDDLVLIADPWNLDAAMHTLTEELLAVGIKVNPSKSAVYVQAGSDGDVAPFPVTSIPRVVGGLPALGCAYSGEYEAVLSPEAVVSAPARKRLEQAIRLAKACADFRDASLAVESLQAAWHILQMVVARALAYDLRTLDPEVVAPLAAELDASVEAAAKALLGAGADAGWDEHTGQQLTWPVALGGMGFGSATVMAEVSRLAALTQCLPVARQHLRNLFPDEAEESIREAIPLEAVDRALRNLRDTYGIEVSADGRVATGQEPRLDLHDDFVPIKGLGGTLARAIYEMQRSRRLEDLEKQELQARQLAKHLRRRDHAAAAEARSAALGFMRTRVRLRSVAGPGCGDWVTAGPTDAALRMNDFEFKFAVRWRLGLTTCLAGNPCGLKPGGQPSGQGACRDVAARRCGKALDPFGDHAILCGKGPGRYRVHNAVCRAIARIARETGAEVELEEVCPALLRGTPGDPNAVEARLDVHFWTHGMECAQEGWVDVVVTHPWRLALRAVAATTDGAAAADAHRRKRARYGDGKGGVTVAPFPIEAWGRFGEGAESVVQILASAWQHRRDASPEAVAASVRRWRAAIGVAVARAQAATFSAAVATCAPCAGDGSCASDSDAGEGALAVAP